MSAENPWRPVAELPDDAGDELVLAVCADRRDRYRGWEPVPCVYAASILKREVATEHTLPPHLQFGATHWMPLDALIAFLPKPRWAK